MRALILPIASLALIALAPAASAQIITRDPATTGGSGSLAQSATAPRTRMVSILKGEACPRSDDPDEIIVCAERDPEDQFRIPPIIREEQRIARRDNVPAQRAGLVDANLAGGQCSAVGSMGQTGCSQGLSVLGMGRKLLEAVDGEDPVAAPAPR
ncbi:MAG: hypothetical protein ACK40H_01680 [Sphingomonadaceae bacterium]